MSRKHKKNFKKTEENYKLACKSCPLHKEDGEKMCCNVKHPMEKEYDPRNTLEDWCKKVHRKGSPFESNENLEKYVLMYSDTDFLDASEIAEAFHEPKSEQKFGRIARVEVDGIEFEFKFTPYVGDLSELLCESCPMDGLCDRLKNPYDMKNDEETFRDFCCHGGKNISDEEAYKDETIDGLAPDINDVLKFAKKTAPDVYKDCLAHVGEEKKIVTNIIDGIELIKSKEDTYNLAQNGELIFSQWFSEIIPTKNGKYISNTGYVCVVPVGSVERCLINVSDDTESRIMIGETEGDHRELLETLKEYV
jgi:hypothetical protein